MFTAVENALAHARLPYVGLALLVYAISVPLAAMRWRTILRGLDERVPVGRLILVNMAASFVNNVTPAARAAGEVCRVVGLVRMRLSPLTSAAAVAYDRISEIPAIALLVLIVLLFLPGKRAVPAFRVLTVVAIGAVVVGCAWRWIRSRFTVRLAPSALLSAIAMSMLLWSLDALRLRMAAAALDAPIGLTQAAALSAITVAAGWVPTIGGLGAIEGGLMAGLIGFGVAPADAAAVTAIERAISYGLATIAGAGAMSLVGGRELWRTIRLRGRPDLLTSGDAVTSAVSS